MAQRSKSLEQFKFMDNHFLIALDGTGFFSSDKVHCANCCIKETKTGAPQYYHQMMCGALVHPSKKIVLPLAPEPIMQQDGTDKNDCERNASKRFLEDLRR